MNNEKIQTLKNDYENDLKEIEDMMNASIDVDSNTYQYNLGQRDRLYFVIEDLEELLK